MSLNYRIDENNAVEQARVHEGEVDNVVTTHAVTDTHEWEGHLAAEVVDHVKEISWMIVPRSLEIYHQRMLETQSLEALVCQRTVIAKLLLIQNSTLALPCHVCHPYTADLKAARLCYLLVHIVPQWLI